jgi:hypothetical protein
MKKASVMLVGLFILTVSFHPAWAQKEKFHSIFLYSFSKYVKWPEAQKSEKFVIGVVGASAIQKDLKSMAASKKVNGMPIEIKQFKSVSEITGCHILYVSASASGKIDQITTITQDQSVLIVTDKPGLAKKGAAINFVEVDGKIKFELNQQNAKSRGLKISGSLASLAILV